MVEPLANVVAAAIAGVPVDHPVGGENSFLSIPCFALVPESKQVNHIEIRLVTVQRNISGITKVYDQLAQFREHVKWPADLGITFQR
jgi:hypothetical protein